MGDLETLTSNVERVVMRSIKSTLDENVVTVAGLATGWYVGTPSSGAPIEVLESEGRLFAGIANMTVFSTGFESSEQENARLLAENYALKERVRAIEERLTNIEVAVPKEKVVILRELTKEEAEKEIVKLFSERETVYYSDIAERLGIDLKFVVEICNELQNRGEIEVVDDIL